MGSRGPHVPSPVLTPQAEPLGTHPVREPRPSDSALVQCDDFRRAAPSEAEKHRNAASLGVGGVTGSPVPTAHTLLSLLQWGQGVRGEKSGIFWGSGVVLHGVQ